MRPANCLFAARDIIETKAMRNCEIYAIPSYTEFRNFGIPDDGNLTEIYWTSLNPELRVRKFNGNLNGITEFPLLTELPGNKCYFRYYQN